MKNLLYLFFVLIFFSACKNEPIQPKTPESYLGHVDLVLDSATFHAVVQDTFLTQAFAAFYQDTTQYSKPSYDLYLLGQESFLHLSLASEYWEGKTGSGVIIFQSLFPSKGDSLRLAWKNQTSDSLYFHTFQGGDFQLEEIMPYRAKDSTQLPTPNFTPILTSYTTESYSNWGFDAAQIQKGITGKQFMNSWDPACETKLFKKIKSLQVQISPREMEELEPALMALGYKKGADSFTHESHPQIFFSVSETQASPKYTKVEIEITDPTLNYQTTLGIMYQVKVENGVLTLQSL